MERCISGVVKSRWMHDFDSYRVKQLGNDGNVKALIVCCYGEQSFEHDLCSKTWK
jgi:hypothetical protein